MKKIRTLNGQFFVTDCSVNTKWTMCTKFRSLEAFFCFSIFIHCHNVLFLLLCVLLSWTFQKFSVGSLIPFFGSQSTVIHYYFCFAYISDPISTAIILPLAINRSVIKWSIILSRTKESEDKSSNDSDLNMLRRTENKMATHTKGKKTKGTRTQGRVIIEENGSGGNGRHLLTNGE